jgi:hypothetical protein
VEDEPEGMRMVGGGGAMVRVAVGGPEGTSEISTIFGNSFHFKTVCRNNLHLLFTTISITIKPIIIFTQKIGIDGSVTIAGA